MPPLRIPQPHPPRARRLVVDDPAKTLTPEDRADLLFDLNRESGTTLVLVTHDAGLASRCDRRITIRAGEVFAG